MRNIVTDVLSLKQKNQMLCKGVLSLVVFVLVMLGGMLGLSFVAIEATKESHVKSDGLVVGTSGQIVKTDIAESEYPFFGLTALDATR